ncbi:hypothetical protein [Methanothrix thermoacetophila]|uniref:Uncharacterized protein n=3 Tax=Methanothrix TaxID=2222 RepID=A0B9B2_METTP|nr:hypothetical protein [Methanothrix thermoacetophila]ABK15286.1 hypothetical protein Mthe_1514 [Methanothrix thermoacetophila PT]ABK15293.1 hypothetical protein Mthe_1521 [Methanothrix thermoacetophila PT]ABK15300.1 hypothetical protein Mthe_1528 [Methanothrix thermoacetophila PT]
MLIWINEGTLLEDPWLTYSSSSIVESLCEPSFYIDCPIQQNGGMMVSIKVDADAKARLQGDESLERYPIVAKVTGSGKDGSLGVRISSDGEPLPAAVSVNGDVGIDIRELSSVAESLAKLVSSGLKISDAPVTVSLEEIPVDLTISVYSPKEEQVFRVQIKGSLGK